VVGRVALNVFNAAQKMSGGQPERVYRKYSAQVNLANPMEVLDE
jgi:hypothetical protein